MIGDKDARGNTLRLGGRKVNIWQRPDDFFELRFVEHKGFFAVETEKEAIQYYNKIEPSNHIKLPMLPPLRDVEDGEPIYPSIPDGCTLRCLGRLQIRENR